MKVQKDVKGKYFSKISNKINLYTRTDSLIYWVYNSGEMKRLLTYLFLVTALIFSISTKANAAGIRTGYQVFEFKYKELITVPQSILPLIENRKFKKPKKVKMTLKIEGMLDEKGFFSNGKSTTFFKNKRYKNKKGVVTNVTYAIKSSYFACVDDVFAKSQGGLCTIEAIGYTQGYYAAPHVFFAMQEWEKIAKDF